MRSTLALWHEPIGKPDGYVDDELKDRPGIELHFNLWRDLTAGMNFLDIGLRFRDVANLSQVYLFFPAPLSLSHIRDLSTVLKFGSTLNAVFNTVVTVGRQADHWFTTKRAGEPFVTVHHVRVGDDLRLEPVMMDDGYAGTLVTLTETFCARLRSAVGTPAHYIRFRLDLKGPAKELFSSEITANDRLVASSLGKLELTEFRLNEIRSYPARISELARRKEFKIEAVHYFLIRDLEHQLTMQHAPFRKVRRLESDLWLPYLQGEASDSIPAITERLAKRMVIYHWRVDRDPGSDGRSSKEIDDFIAFASFRATAPNLSIYIAAIVLIGALGSLAASAVLPVISWLKLPWLPGRPVALTDDVLAYDAARNLWLLTIASGLLALFALALSPAFRSRVGSIFSRIMGTRRR